MVMWAYNTISADTMKNEFKYMTYVLMQEITYAKYSSEYVCTCMPLYANHYF